MERDPALSNMKNYMIDCNTCNTENFGITTPPMLTLYAKAYCLTANGYPSVDAGMRERRLRRALWLAKASEASKEVNYWNCENESSYAIVDFNVHHETIVSYKAPHHRPYKWIQIWENVERKCRAKAEEYK